MSTRKQTRKFSSEFKAKVALETIKGESTLTEIGAKYELHVNQILQWKKEFLANMGAAFDKNNQKEEDEKEKDKLHKKIGQLEMEL